MSKPLRMLKLFAIVLVTISVFSAIVASLPYSLAVSDISLQNQPLQKQIRHSGIYTENEIETSLLYVGQQVHIAFSTLSISNPNGVQIKIGYQIVEDRDFPRYDDEMIEFVSNSMDFSRPVSFPYTPNESGEYFLRLNMSCHDPSDNSSGGGGGGSNSFQVVDKPSKAIDVDSGLCKRYDFIPFVKSDYSTVVCVSPDTWFKLMTRGY
ncbi:hypothetical protein K0U27_01840 [archaeon]|nr:hypothetical protein [archaeon]